MQEGCSRVEAGGGFAKVDLWKQKSRLRGQASLLQGLCAKTPVDHCIDNRQSFTLNPRGCLTIMARFHFPAREPPRCCVSAKKL